MENIQHKAFKTQIDKNTEGKISAYVSVYGNVDSANEICDYGCFAESLANKFPVMCLYHNWEMPIGKVIVGEEIPAGDERLPEELKEFGGLYIEAQLNLDKQIAKEAWSDIKMGVLSEYSIGYVVLKDSIDDQGYRHLTKVDLIECSPVVRAANPMTKTLEVKSAIIETKEEEEKEKENTSQINTKQMKELLDTIQEYLTAVMGPLDELRVMLAEQGLLESAPAATEPAPTEPTQADDNTEDTEVKALDLPAVLEALTEIITIAEAVVGFDLEVSNADMKSIDEIMTSIAGLQSVVQTEIDTPTGEVDLQAMVDAFTIVNTNVDELIAEAQAIDPETNPEVADYIVNLEQIKAIATELMETVMAEMEALVEAPPEETADGTKAVARRISLDEQIELEQLFSRVLQSQFNINQ